MRFQLQLAGRGSEAPDRAHRDKSGRERAIRDEAASAGRYQSKLWQKDYPKIQIITIAGLLDGSETLNAPPSINPFAIAPREAGEHKQTEML